MHSRLKIRKVKLVMSATLELKFALKNTKVEVPCDNVSEAFVIEIWEFFFNRRDQLVINDLEINRMSSSVSKASNAPHIQLRSDVTHRPDICATPAHHDLRRPRGSNRRQLL